MNGNNLLHLGPKMLEVGKKMLLCREFPFLLEWLKQRFRQVSQFVGPVRIDMQHRQVCIHLCSQLKRIAQGPLRGRRKRKAGQEFHCGAENASIA